jgi:hypothetical protein
MKVYGAVLIGGVCLIIAAVLHGVVSRPPDDDNDRDHVLQGELVNYWAFTVLAGNKEVGDKSQLNARYELFETDAAIIIKPIDGAGYLRVIPVARLVSFQAHPATDKD